MKVAVICLLAALAVCSSMAQSQHMTADVPNEERVYDLDDNIKPPRVTHQVRPDYSRIRGVRVKGSVAIALVVSSQGTPKDPRVVQSLDPEVDRCAVDAIKQWRFSPAEEDGAPGAVNVTIEIQFHSM